MKLKLRLVIFIGLVFLINVSQSQRFLTPVFDQISVTSDIPYGNAVNYQNEVEELLLDFYEPMNDTMEYRPLLIYTHGGGFQDVNQSKNLEHIEAYCDSLAKRGYTTASINYRLDTLICNRAVINAMHDLKAAVRFFKLNFETYKVNPELIFVAGESAGAVTSLNCAYINEEIEVLYPNNPPLSLDLTVDGSSGNPGFDSDVKAVLSLCGGTKTVLNELLFDTLAIQTPNDPPLVMVHGTADPLIPTINALEIAIRANNVGVPNLFFTLPEATHCPWFIGLEDSWQYLDTLIDYTVPFLYSCVTTSNIEEPDYIPTITIYPNPSSDLINIDGLELGFRQYEYIIYDSKGIIVKRKNLLSKVIDIKSLSAGVYTIFLFGEGLKHHQKLVVK